MLVFAIAVYVYFYKSREMPTGYHLDSVTDVFNALCIRLSGADEYGTFLPWYFRAFNDYRPPLIIYAFALSDFIYPLTLYSSRIISMFMGATAIFAAVFFIYRSKEFPKFRFPLAYPLMTLFLLVSSWMLLPHRIPIEFAGVCFVMMGFIATGWWLIEKPESKARGFGHALFWASLLYMYYGSKSLYFIWFPFPFIFIHLKGIPFSLKRCQGLFVAVLVAIALGIPTFDDLLHAQKTLQRFQVVKALEPVGVVTRYFQHMGPDFLFFQGDGNSRHHTQYKGELNQFFLPCYLLGFAAALLQIIRRRNFFWAYIASVFAISYAPAALTNEGIPHSIRTLMAVIPVVFVCFLGYSEIEKWIYSGKKRNIKLLLLSALFLFGIKESYANLYQYHVVQVPNDHYIWSYFDGQYKPPETKLPYDNREFEPVMERYYRFVYENEHKYCDRELNPK